MKKAKVFWIFKTADDCLAACPYYKNDPGPFKGCIKVREVLDPDPKDEIIKDLQKRIELFEKSFQRDPYGDCPECNKNYWNLRDLVSAEKVTDEIK